MKAIVVTDQAAGTAGMKLAERPNSQAAINDVVVEIHAPGQRHQRARALQDEVSGSFVYEETDKARSLRTKHGPLGCRGKCLLRETL